MPHFVIEYPRSVESTIDIKPMMVLVAELGARSGVMNARDIKVRAIAYDHYQWNDGSSEFIHLTVYLLDGRTVEQRRGLAELLRAGLAEAYPSIGSISVDIREMDSEVYKKRVLSP